jgi:hypothetical protein
MIGARRRSEEEGGGGVGGSIGSAVARDLKRGLGAMKSTFDETGSP